MSISDVAVNLGSGQGTTQQGILGYHTAFVGVNQTAIRYAVVVSSWRAARNSVLPEATTAIEDQMIGRHFPRVGRGRQ